MAKSCLCGATSFFALMISAPALGQEKTDPSTATPAPTEASRTAAAAAADDIVITGSRIRRAGFDTLQPAIVQDRQTIERRGITDIGQLLNEQAAFSIPSSAPVGPGENGPNVGQTQVNFLGLGSSRTLTLVNGKRFVSSNSVSNLTAPGLQVDLNTIPVALVERIETIAVGGAPVYGADAIAGTVNIIMRKRFEGIEASAQTGIAPDYGDAFRFRGSLVAGTNFAEGRGNIMAAFDYTVSDGLLYSDRPATAGRGYAFQSPPAGSPFSQVLYRDVRVAVTNDNGLALLSSRRGVFATNGAGARLDPSNPGSPLAQFDAQGNLVAYNPGTATGNPVFYSGGDGRNVTLSRGLNHDVERLNATLFTSYDLSDNVRARAEGWYYRSTITELVNEGWYQGSAFGGGNSLTNFGQGPVPVLLTNPFVTASTRANLSRQLDRNGDGLPDNNIDTNGDGVADAPGFFVDRAFGSFQDGAPATATQSLYRLVGQLEGDFQLGSSKFNWDAAITYGRAKSTGSTERVVRPRFNQAVNAVRDPTTGNIVCADPSFGCVPLNVMTGSPDRAALAFVTAPDEPVAVNTQLDITVNVSAGLFKLPAGIVNLATGVEYRRETARYTPSVPDRQGLFDTQTLPIRGGFHTREAYAEILVPLLDAEMGIPLVEQLQFEGALRRVDHSVAGGAWTWTAGGRYKPVADLELRGNYTRSIRSPSITELFLPTTTIQILARDPCDARFIAQGNFPARRQAACAAAGLPANFRSLISDATQRGTSSGNPDLRNEEARSWTVGAVLRPSFVPRLQAAIDWISIDIRNGIQTLGGEAILQSCYDSATYPDEPVCSSFTRGPDGQITSIRTGFVNVASLRYAGLLSTLDYTIPLAGDLSLILHADYNYTDRLVQTVGAANPRQLDGELGNSKHRVNASALLTNGLFTFFNQVRWLSSAVFDSTDGPSTRDVRGVPAWWVWNSAVGVNVGKNFSLQLNVDNLLNRKAPFGTPIIFGATGGSFLAYYEGIRGRYASLTARMRF